MEQDTGVDLHFLPLGENRGVPRSSPREQQSTGLLQLDGFDSLPKQEKGNHPGWDGFYLEQDTGVEPHHNRCGSKTFCIYG